MAITNLTNTKWVFNETIVSTGASIDINLNYTLYDGSSYRKLIIQDANIDGLATDAPADYMTNKLYSHSAGWLNENAKTITIIDGDGVENADLIAFLQANAVQEKPLEFTRTKAAIKIYEDLTQEEYDALTKEPHSFYLVNGVGIYKGTTLISAGANSSMDEIVEELNQAIAAKQDTLVSGTNIKTINGESILGEGNIEVAASDDGVDTAYVENEVLYIDDDTSAGGGNSGLTEDDVNNIISSNDTIVTLTNDIRDLQTDKQDTLVSGTNIKTINNQSILGSGNITIEGGGEGVEIINADLSWMTSQTTGVIPSQYRDIERLKRAIIVVPDEQVGTFAFRYSFNTGDYYYFTFLTSVDNRPNAIDYHIVLIDISNWEFSIGSGKFNNTKANFVLDGTETELKSIMVGDDYYKVSSAPQVIAITNMPNTATSGTLTQDQVEILQASNQNYIIFNNELFRLNDKQHNEGYLVYSHNGHDTTGCFFQKCITITLSTRGWVLEEQENQEKLESGVNIKTINGTSILGSGDLTIEGGSGSGTTVEANPTLSGSEADLTSIAIDGTNYKLSSGGSMNIVPITESLTWDETAITLTKERYDELMAASHISVALEASTLIFNTTAQNSGLKTFISTIFEGSLYCFMVILMEDPEGTYNLIGTKTLITINPTALTSGNIPVAIDGGMIEDSGVALDSVATVDYVDNKITTVLNSDGTLDLIIN